ncbi:hypothetical protein SAMN03159341_11822 [Paenibacillus sp. 1_12]|uniref:hypothetical protein n=1 Tax=Paenibacillus sp. 1_12 TaxID=1566278 RepID=UPI0008E3C00B|nr:hypothetical protein [Paenibacillus sp. 1_12]SFM14518.1 hypothetical protein SAMN03159341_11822 [Paenibacillus sp. 1_12]
MTTKTSSIHRVDLGKAHTDNGIARLVTLMTCFAWVALGIGVLLCLMNLSHFSDRNTGLMVGLGFIVGSVHIFVIGTAMGLVHKRHQDHNKLPF